MGLQVAAILVEGALVAMSTHSLPIASPLCSSSSRTKHEEKQSCTQAWQGRATSCTERARWAAKFTPVRRMLCTSRAYPRSPPCTQSSRSSMLKTICLFAMYKFPDLGDFGL